MNCLLPRYVAYIQFPHIFRSGQILKWKFEYLNRYTPLDKTKKIVETNIVIIKMIEILVCLSSSRVGAHESNRSNICLGQKLLKGI